MINMLKLVWRYKYLVYTVPLQMIARFVPFGNAFFHRLRGVKIGKGCIIPKEVFIDEMEPKLIEIGNNVTIAPNVMILAHTNYGKGLYPYVGKRKTAKVVIKDNVFIGAGSIILNGVTINENSIIGAGSVVTKEVLKETIVAGVPAKQVRKLKKKFKGDISTCDMFF